MKKKKWFLIGILEGLVQNYAVSSFGLWQGWWIVGGCVAEQTATAVIQEGQEWGGVGDALPGDVSSKYRLPVRYHLPEVPTSVNRSTLEPKPS